VGQIHNVKIANKYFKNVTKLKYLGVTITNYSHIHEKIKSRINSWNSCYHSLQNVFPSPKNVMIKIYRITILHAVLHGGKGRTMIEGT
jgi:hypothetical protein